MLQNVKFNLPENWFKVILIIKDVQKIINLWKF